MNIKLNWLRGTLCFVLLLCLVVTANAGTLPVRWYQEQTVYVAATSVRALQRDAVWQSFTVDCKGTLAEIGVAFLNDFAGTIKLEIFQGRSPEDSNAKILQTLTVPVVSKGPNPNWNKWEVNVTVQARTQYFFRLSPEFDVDGKANMFEIAIGSNNPYPGGVMGGGDCAGIKEPDMMFCAGGWISFG